MDEDSDVRERREAWLARTRLAMDAGVPPMSAAGALALHQANAQALRTLESIARETA